MRLTQSKFLIRAGGKLPAQHFGVSILDRKRELRRDMLASIARQHKVSSRHGQPGWRQ